MMTKNKERELLDNIYNIENELKIIEKELDYIIDNAPEDGAVAELLEIERGYLLSELEITKDSYMLLTKDK
tara:strand:- start:716 stop:928 length:213 start_codon:yes stop_codon:yes gene_type:complete